MKKLGIILTLLLLIGLLAMLLATPASAATYSGTCGGEGDGSNLTWTLDTETGKLLIQGTGAMEDTSWINQPSSPFYSQRQYIKEVIVEEGVTSIGDWSFRNCENLISVMLPNSLIRVGWCAFLGCENLECIRIPESVTDINPRAFAGCSSLSEISLPLSIQRIGKEAFYGTAYAKNEENWYEGCLYCDGWLLEADKNRVGLP